MEMEEKEKQRDTKAKILLQEKKLILNNKLKMLKTQIKKLLNWKKPQMILKINHMRKEISKHNAIALQLK